MKPEAKTIKLADRKMIRAIEIDVYMDKAGYEKAVCFSCGNASSELRWQGVDVLDISQSGDLEARRWFTQAEIRATWPHAFDATSGHLPAELMYRIGLRLAKLHGLQEGEIYTIDCGSGETLVALKMARPGCRFIAWFDNSKPGTEFHSEAPLIPLVLALSDQVWIDAAMVTEVIND